ncbi:MAG: hypothetical protein V4648_01525 [Bacteroidota bacterium]
MRKILFSIGVIFLVVILQGSSIAKTTSYETSDTIKLSYKKDIVPIMQTSCTPCHFPPDGRKEPLDSYETVKNNIAAVIERVKLPKDDVKYMPFKSKKPALNDSLIAILQTWQKQNMPE